MPSAQTHAADVRDAGHHGLDGEQAVDGDTGAHFDVSLRQRGAAQDPLEGRAPAGDHREIGVVGLWYEADHRRRQVLAEADLGRSHLQQLRQNVGVVVPEQVRQPGEEGVALAHLRRAPAVPLEGVVGRRRHRRVIAFEHRHLVSRPRQRER